MTISETRGANNPPMVDASHDHIYPRGFPAGTHVVLFQDIIFKSADFSGSSLATQFMAAHEPAARYRRAPDGRRAPSPNSAYVRPFRRPLRPPPPPLKYDENGNPYTPSCLPGSVTAPLSPPRSDTDSSDSGPWHRPISRLGPPPPPLRYDKNGNPCTPSCLPGSVTAPLSPPQTDTDGSDGSYSPGPWHHPISRLHPRPPPRRFNQDGHLSPPPRPSALINPPVVPLPLNDNAPEPHRSSPPHQSTPDIPPTPPVIPPTPVVIPPTPSVVPPTPFIPHTPVISPTHTSSAHVPQPNHPQPYQPNPFIPPVAPGLYSVLNSTSRRAAAPVPPHLTYWYPPGVVPHHLYAQTSVPMMYPGYYLPQQQPLGTVVPAPPIPPVIRQQRPSVPNPFPPKQTEEAIVPFIPPMPDLKPDPQQAPRPILKPKPASAVKSTKAAASSEDNDVQTFKNTVANASTNLPDRRNILRMQSPPPGLKVEMEAAVNAKRSSKSDESLAIVAEEDEITDSDFGVESGPLHDLRKHKPIHTHSSISSSSSSLPSLDSHLHLMCPDCHTMHCRGCNRMLNCKRTCNGGPDDKCLLKTCCRAGRAIAIFAILSCFDAKFLSMVSKSSHSTYLEYIKSRLSSSTSSLSTLLLTTIESLLLWLPVDPIHSKSPPHVHTSVEPLFRVSLLLEVIRTYLRAPRERWIRSGNGMVYRHLLMFLRRLEEVGKGAIAGLVFRPAKGVERTTGVGEVVWALAEKNKGTGKKRNLGWTAGDEHESFSATLSKKKLQQDLQALKDKEEKKEKKALLDQFLCQLLRWSMADVLKN
ncbi:hypothetical protein C0995_003383 [Termitomyces sp. Mi166|nr:hypothetical protein C0995_003383 [Termitomyces sp. Mi166\